MPEQPLPTVDISTFGGESKFFTVLHGVAYDERSLVRMNPYVDGIQQYTTETLVTLRMSKLHGSTTHRLGVPVQIVVSEHHISVLRNFV